MPVCLVSVVPFYVGETEAGDGQCLSQDHTASTWQLKASPPCSLAKSLPCQASDVGAGLSLGGGIWLLVDL